MPSVANIVAAIENRAPLALQEKWDNSGLQTGHYSDAVTGVLVALDPTPERIDEAVALGANMVVSHHPLIFRPLRNLTDSNRTQRAVEKAIRQDVAIYSAHTSLDNTEGGVSHLLARRLGAKVVGPLVPAAPGATCGTGVICELPRMTPAELVEIVQRELQVPVIRTSDMNAGPEYVRRIAVCGGSGGSFIEDAVRADVQAYITGDIKYHDFIDYAEKVFLLDCGHFETEMLCRDLLAETIRNACPGLPVFVSQQERNPVKYVTK